ncbi:phage tail sheath C-terminal domain-containing protein [Nocardia sp. NPDC050712]|uniref:phage tail sheath C-terminal domain-containing protein n=1 Tax=Nocardia sp. NPDC050712 TaxID=3155518 RepID=UPI0033DEA79B
MAFNIGVNVVEVDGATAPSVTGAAVSVAGFAVLTERGVPHQPQRISNYPQFVERFGGYFPGGLGAYLVKGFFDNGGQTAYVSRVVDGDNAVGAKPASVDLTDAANTKVGAVSAGFRGQPDPGAWGRRLAVRIRHSSSASSPLLENQPATVTGNALGAATVDMTDAPKLLVKVDDATAATEIAFFAEDFADKTKAKAKEIADAINRRTTRLRASTEGSGASAKIVLTSTGEAVPAGSGTSLQITADHPKAGFTTMANPKPGTVEPLTASGSKLAAPGDFALGEHIVITAGSVTAAGPHAISAIDHRTGAVNWTPAMTNLADFTDHSAVVVAKVEFDVLVADGGADSAHVVETFAGLTLEPSLPNYASRVLDHPLTGSKLVQFDDVEAANRKRPAEKWYPLAGGSDGKPKAGDFKGEEAKGTGLSAFSPYDIQLLCTESTEVVVALAGLAYCEQRGDAMYVGAVPRGEDAIAFGQKLKTKKSYGALYHPWLVVPDPIGLGGNPRISIPPVGHVLGVFARTENTRGVWKAPAGDEANLLGVLDTETHYSDADHTQLAVEGGVNGIRPIPRAGIVIDSSRTLSDDPRWRYVNVRLLFNYVKSSLRASLRSVRQEPNRESLWTTVKFGTVSPFLMGLWRQGAFGTGSPEQTFTVIVDANNNPPDQVEQGKLTVEVYFYPSRPAETIVLVCGQQPSGATVSEA